MEKHLQNYLPYFINQRSEYSAIDFFKHYNFTHRDKKTAHTALYKCLKHLSSCSDTELQEKAKKITKSLEVCLVELYL